MATKKKPKATSLEEKEIRTYNPTKSNFGKIIIIILALGMFLSMLIAAIIGIVQSFE